ncbi:MAG: right-handed parallel beta-helix repeat-containing protein [Candidatus Electrothrix aestuarii]|uniref:Right-handed parallel beta-helix repeat-containing protein n=1 Tax=Candidatus Electrothrix aestuarii TaxID=3062594 RepID=A0AAU8LWQ6_9BACT|nr:NosD domain-containing protein [Candidatus Electrothrix aestuarii]
MMSKKIMLSLLAGLAATLLTLQSGFAKELVVEKGVIDKDTTWSGDILVKGDVEVAKEATLIIMPGTTVRFAKIEAFGPDKRYTDKDNHFSRAEIFVLGKLYAQGTKEKKIVFTSAEEKPAPGDWGAINFNGSIDNLIEYCELMYAQTAVHCHSSQIVVVNNTFKHNGTAIGSKNLPDVPVRCSMPVLYNLVTENGGGIIVGGGTASPVAHNEISGNEFFGVYVKKGGRAAIRFNNINKNGKGVIFYATKEAMLQDNNIADNENYNISMLEGQADDIVARNNWWGTTDEKKIMEKVMDKGREETLGKVDLTDFYAAPVSGAGLH